LALAGTPVPACCRRAAVPLSRRARCPPFEFARRQGRAL